MTAEELVRRTLVWAQQRCRHAIVNFRDDPAEQRGVRFVERVVLGVRPEDVLASIAPPCARCAGRLTHIQSECTCTIG